MMDNQDTQNIFSVSFTVPELINPRDTFSCNKELSSEWNDIVEKNFPEKLERDFEKEKLMNLSINEINWDGEAFEFKVDGKNLNDDDKLVIAYILAKSVQKEHDLNEAKIDIQIISGDHKKNVIF